MITRSSKSEKRTSWPFRSFKAKSYCEVSRFSFSPRQAMKNNPIDKPTTKTFHIVQQHLAIISLASSGSALLYHL
jgi:hypothetical protein